MSAPVVAGTPNGAANPATVTVTPAYDKGDLESRLRNEGDFAVAEYKKGQAYIAELQGKLRGAETRMAQLGQLPEAAHLVGSGNVEAGAAEIWNLADKALRFQSDPKMKHVMDTYLASGKLPDAQEEEFISPEQRENRELRETVRRLETQVGQTQGQQAVLQMTGHIQSFFDSDEMGRAIDGSLRSDTFKAIQERFVQWAKTPEGRRQLSTLDSESVRLIVVDHLMKAGKLYEVTDRARALKEGAVLGSPEVRALSGAATEDAPDFQGPKAALQAVNYAARKFGVKL